MYTKKNHSINLFNNKLLKIYISIFTASLFSFFLSSFPVDAFYDRVNYLSYAENSNIVFTRYYSSGILRVLFNEPVWLQINILLGSFLSKENVVRVIIFLSTFITSFLILKNNFRYFPLVILIILLPQVIKNNIVHLRQGLALSFFLIGWYASSERVKLLFLLLSPFIHSSFFFVITVFFITKTLENYKLSSGIKSIAIISFSFILSALIPFISTALNARQAESYNYIGTTGSGIAFFFWATILVIFLCNGKYFLKNKSFEVGMLIFYLATYFFLPTSARIFENAILLVLIAGLYLEKWRKNVFLTLFLCYFLYLYQGRIGLPLFGWAVKI